MKRMKVSPTEKKIPAIEKKKEKTLHLTCIKKKILYLLK